MVGKKGLFELKKCTVSGLKRQFDKWHLFSAPTAAPGNSGNFILGIPNGHFGMSFLGGWGWPKLICWAHGESYVCNHVETHCMLGAWNSAKSWLGGKPSKPTPQQVKEEANLPQKRRLSVPLPSLDRNTTTIACLIPGSFLAPVSLTSHKAWMKSNYSHGLGRL